jgi:hypothetical protein
MEPYPPSLEGFPEAAGEGIDVGREQIERRSVKLPRPKHAPALRRFIDETVRLRLDLSELKLRFPERDVPLGDQIFIRLFDPVWRPRIGIPLNEKEAAVIQWLGEFRVYYQNLEETLAFVLRQPELVRTLPTHGLNGFHQPSADWVIKALHLQEDLLRALQQSDSGTPSPQTNEPRKAEPKWLKLLRAKVDQLGVKSVASITGLNRDTINDLLTGRHKQPRGSTVQKIELLRQYK